MISPESVDVHACSSAHHGQMRREPMNVQFPRGVYKILRNKEVVI